MGPVFQGSARSGPDSFVIAVTVLFTILFHSRPDKSCRLVELFKRTIISLQVGMPVCEKSAGFLEHVFRKNIGVRASPVFFESLELSYEVSPAKLAFSIVMIGTVSGIIVTTNDTIKDRAEYLFQDF